MPADLALTSSLALEPFAGLVAGAEYIAQQVRLRFTVLRGDVPSDRRKGAPWVEWFGQKPFPAALATAWARREVASIPGVIQVANVSSSVDEASRAFSVSMDIQTEEGVTTLEVTRSSRQAAINLGGQAVICAV